MPSQPTVPANGPAPDAPNQPGGVSGPGNAPLSSSLDPSLLSGFIGFFVCAGLVNAVIAAVLLCRLPEARVPSAAGTLVRAAAYVALAAVAGVAGALFYWRSGSNPYRIRGPLPFRQFALLCAAGWMWVPAAVLLSAQKSPAAALLGGFAGAIIAAGLRKAIPAPDEPHLATAVSHPELFAQTLRIPPRPMHGYVISVCGYAAFYAMRDRSNMTAAALLAIAGFLFAWNWNLAPAAVDPRQVERRARRRLARLALPAVLITAWALLLGIARRDRMENAAFANAASGAANSRQVTRVEPALGPGGYQSIILWPLPPRKQVIPPLPAPANYQGPDRSRPMVIRFDGNYWYFQPPETRPGRSAHQAHGTPLTVDVQSNNNLTLMMEAHQRLIGPIRTSRCREIDVEVQNRDNMPGSISLAMLLADSNNPGKESLYLPQQPVETSEPGHFFVKTHPVSETIRFAIPPGSGLRKFDDITVILIPDLEHVMVGPKIAIEQFELLPR